MEQLPMEESMIQVRVFTMPFNFQAGIFDDEKFNNFVKDKELISVKDYFFQRDEIPYLTLVVQYKSLPLSSGEKAKGHEEWRKLLDETSMPLFNTLRQWRNETSKKDGVPPYIILNNKQLAEVCKKRPQSQYDLMKVEGIGKAKAEKYGQDILKLTAYLKKEEKTDEQLASASQ
ncbi:MAG: HRDC domain-containing protein [Oligoflexia bacterium]|nr:HRDC domain-containing protein [Oligoflexia bacterium]